jgi:predicted ester cyclase
VNIKDLAQQIDDAWNARDQETFLSYHDPEHEAVAPGFTGKGEQGLREFWALWNDAFPDNRVTTQIMVAEGDTVAQASMFQGTHAGPLANPDGEAIPPTGRPVSVPFSSFTTMRNERALRTMFQFDRLELLQQLGIPPGGQ